MVAVIAMLALINVASMVLVRLPSISSAGVLAALLVDVGALTVQLYLSGGSDNPFISLYVLQIVLGAILLDLRSAWVLMGCAGLCFAFLTMNHLPLVFPYELMPEVADLTTLGNWLSFALVGVLLLLFTARISRNLRARDAYLADLRQHAVEEDYIVRMGLFASGAAHELGTPLATLSVILGDWRHMPKLKDDLELSAEIEEMQEEVGRCKRIVTDILHVAGQPRGQELASTPADGFVDAVAAAWCQIHPSASLSVRREGTEGVSIVADPALRQAIWNLLDNAFEASTDGVSFYIRREEDRLALSVRDRGKGFDPKRLENFGKPSPSDKGPGHGVGLFLVSNVMRRLEGDVAARNLPEGGAEVTLTLPLAAHQN
ncbi:sensor histidine kinase [Aureimonas psammosilenae]|uniref:sensor histidine kinase n=1 Tax=Aureimonas psammosilenae TaxID=2495496 RepID=UPI001AEE0E57|nr:ATP-binding protein [Aureimonas psammosilenae]